MLAILVSIVLALVVGVVGGLIFILGIVILTDFLLNGKSYKNFRKRLIAVSLGVGLLTGGGALFATGGKMLIAANEAEIIYEAPASPAPPSSENPAPATNGGVVFLHNFLTRGIGN